MGDDHEVAASIAAEAGRLLLALRAERGRDASPDDLRAEGDRSSHRLILERLGAERPDDPVLSEEGADDARRLSCRRAWIADPLDGTREFGELERDDWTVHVALSVDGRPAAGAVAQPARGLLLGTGRRPAPAAPPARRSRIAVSRSRPPAFVGELARRLDAELVPMGSAGAKILAVVLGEVDLYVHAGGQYQWDSAAPVAVALAAGLHACRLDGSPLVYNLPDTRLPDLLVCRPELAARALAAIASLPPPGGREPTA